MSSDTKHVGPSQDEAVFYTYISRVKSPQNERKGRFEESRQAQAITRPLRHKAYRLVTGVLKLCSVVVRNGLVYAAAASLCVRQTWSSRLQSN